MCFFAKGRQQQNTSLRLARRAAWLRILHQWHWISASVSLAGLLLFSVTGITLNHADLIEATPQIDTRNAALPPKLQQALGQMASSQPNAPLPSDARAWVKQTFNVNLGSESAEWTAQEIYISLPEPGGDAWLRIDLEAGNAEYERTTRGWISYLNDLHKGRHTGFAWKIFIDLIAVACLVFAISGLWLLGIHASSRPFTWPFTALGLVIPVLLAILFIQ